MTWLKEFKENQSKELEKIKEEEIDKKR